MGNNILILEITSGICCILTAIFLHYSAIPKSSNKKNYQKGYTVVKIASLMLGISALLFAYFGNVIDTYDKRSFIQIILPVETLLVFWVFVYPLYDKNKLKNFLSIRYFTRQYYAQQTSSTCLLQRGCLENGFIICWCHVMSYNLPFTQ